MWLDRIDSTRNELITAAKNGSRVNAAFAMAEARVALIESLKDEQIRARLLRITDPSIHMVELANNPSDEDRIRVCAIAILSGFCPGDDQFAIFGGKGGGKLYTKEAGFRTLFAHLGIVPELSVGHPEFVPLGNSGKKIWRVSGKASCDYAGKTYSVEFSGAASLGLPGYETDNVAGITAKARRQILKSLWAKVSPILNDDHADEPEILPVGEPAAITQQTEPEELTDLQRQRKLIVGQFDRLRKMIAGDEQHTEFFNGAVLDLEAAKTVDQLGLVRDAMNERRKDMKPLSKPVADELKRFVELRVEELKGGAA